MAKRNLRGELQDERGVLLLCSFLSYQLILVCVLYNATPFNTGLHQSIVSLSVGSTCKTHK